MELTDFKTVQRAELLSKINSLLKDPILGEETKDGIELLDTKVTDLENLKDSDLRNILRLLEAKLFRYLYMHR